MNFCASGLLKTPVVQTGEGGSHPTLALHLRRSDYQVQEVTLAATQEFIREYHYSRGGSNTRVFSHGLFRMGDSQLLGVAWWIPPTKAAAMATFPEDWKRVLALSRLAILPGMPTNSASFLLSRSIAEIRRSKKWACLVTYADTWRGHTGAIYRATNWEYRGLTSPSAVYVKDGRMGSRKAGPKTRTHQGMLDLGYDLVGRFPKHKFRLIL